MCETVTRVYTCACRQHSHFQSCGVKRDRITNSAPICKVVPRNELVAHECKTCILKRVAAESRARAAGYQQSIVQMAVRVDVDVDVDVPVPGKENLRLRDENGGREEEDSEGSVGSTKPLEMKMVTKRG
jgi:hypothetical protein